MLHPCWFLASNTNPIRSVDLNIMASHNISFANACTAQAIPAPQLFGLEILNVQASLVTNFSLSATPIQVWTKSEFAGLDFCNVTIQYTHPGQDDNITVIMQLPEVSKWNGRLAAAGGSGWSAMQGDAGMIPAVDAGFAVVETDAGVTTNSLSPAAWALSSPGNPDLQRLNTFASVAYHDAAMIGKDIVASFYGQPASYSYWIGCSTGGRQGHMMAQRYPEDFDGISALAPGINWGQLMGSLSWARQVMYELDAAPPPCEIAALTAAAIAACDANDGLADGVISAPELCQFDPVELVGQPYDCDGVSRTFTSDAAKVVQNSWAGQRSPTGELLWYGYGFDAFLGYTASTTCSTDDNCTVLPIPLGDDWFRYWVAANPDLDMANLTRTEFDRLYHLGLQRYDSIIGTRDPDLTAFRDVGGKMLTWHGLADELIPYGASVDYYDRVREVDGNVDDYFRLFLSPGTAHCSPGQGPFPHGVLDDLVRWVEEGVAPEQLVAQDLTNIDPATGKLSGGENETAGRGRPLCLYPKTQRYIGGDADLVSSYRCAMP
jgi:pimeloyl-ACP methyl ester carboxylesterase